MMTAIQYFTRDGAACTEPFHVNAKGGAFFTRPKMCGRCGGAGGSDKWAHTGWTCYDCGGRKVIGTETVKVYTADRLAKLNAAKAKADAKRAAAAQAQADARAAEAAARADAFRAQYAALIERAKPHMENEFIGDVMRRAIEMSRITDAQADAVCNAIVRIESRARTAAASRHVGQTGKRLEIAVTVERIAGFSRPSYSGLGSETVWIITMRDADGNCIVSKSASFYADEGQAFTIRATVKEHSEYRDQKQTIVQRIAIVEPKQAAA